MPKQSTPRLRVVRRAVDELSDEQIARLMDFGRREADLITEIEAAVRANDRDLCWQLAQALCRIQDEAEREPPPAA